MLDPVREPVAEDPRAATSARRIDHVAVLVRDGDSALGRFRDEFGLVFAGDWLDPAGRFRLLYLNSGDTTLQLVEPLSPGPLMTHLEERGPGLHHVCFLVDDVDAAIAQASGGPEGLPYVGGRGAKVCFLADRSDGVIIELTESAG
jgi:methylmalonyl-CoA epimerase